MSRFYVGGADRRAFEFFSEDTEAAYFSTKEELLERVRYYLDNRAIRDKIAEGGYIRARRSGYSYNDRVRQMLNVIYSNRHEKSNKLN